MNVPQRITRAVDQLDARPADHILEVGCGAGHALALLCARLKGGSLTAIDRSALQVRRARERAACARVELCALDEAPAILSRRFDKIFAINVNAFWTAPASSFDAVRQMLKRRGQLHLAYEPPSPGQMRKIGELLRRSAAGSGLAVVEERRVEHGALWVFCRAS